MKEALLKKRCGIPAVALLLILMLSGTALAWYCSATISSEATVQEPLSASENAEFSDTMYPGETNTWTFKIENLAPVDYLVKADVTLNAPSGVSITSFKVGDADETSDLKDGNSAEFSVPAGGVWCSMTISAAKDTAPKSVLVRLALSRG